MLSRNLVKFYNKFNELTPDEIRGGKRGGIDDFLVQLTRDETNDFLVHVVKEKNIKILNLVLDFGISPYLPIDRERNTALHLAIKESWEEGVKEFLPREVWSEKDRSIWFDALKVALENGKVDIVNNIILKRDYTKDEISKISKDPGSSVCLDIAIKRGFTDVEDSLRHLDVEPSPQVLHDSHRYTRQIVVCYGEQDSRQYSIDLLKSKWLINHSSNTFHIISGEDFHSGNYDKIPFNENDFARIYIMAHGNKGSETIAEHINDDEYKQYRYDSVATKLAELIGQTKADINLLCCYGSKSDEKDDYGDSKSFAARLHKALSEKIQATYIPKVTARTQRVYRASGKPDTKLDTKLDTIMVDIYGKSVKTYGRKLPFFHPKTTEDFRSEGQLKHKQPGSKATYTFDEKGDQIQYDSYSYKWKEKILKQIKRLIQNQNAGSKHKENQETKLTEMQEQFIKMTPKNIFDRLSSDINDVKSSLPGSRASLPSLTRLFSGKKSKMGLLMDEGRKIFESPHTPHHPIRTGRKKL